MDVRHWTCDFVTEFIEMYKSFPCLWKIKSEGYTNRRIRNQAYDAIVQMCRSRGMKEVNRDYVIKKIQSLKGSFRKEQKKIEAYKRIGKEYQTSLWYYDQLLFTKDQHNSSGMIQFIDDDKSCSDSDIDSDEVREVSVNERDSNNITIGDVYTQKSDHQYATLNANYANEDSNQLRQSKKRQTVVVEGVPAEVLNICVEALKVRKPISEFEAVGVNVAKKLEKMDPNQAIFAEKIITNVLMKGLFNNLTADSYVCDKTFCNKVGPSTVFGSIIDAMDAGVTEVCTSFGTSNSDTISIVNNVQRNNVAENIKREHVDI